MTRFETWWGKIIIAVFLLFVGGAVNQFMNIPAQQIHQDDRLTAIEQRLDRQDIRLGALEAQHAHMINQLDVLRKQHETQ